VSGWALAGLHAVRRRAEEAARVGLAEACALEGRERSERDLAAAAFAALGARAAKAREDVGGASAGAVQARARFAARLRAEERVAGARLAAAEGRVREAERSVARARARLEGARRALETLERRRLAWEEARRRGRERAEDAARDDLPRRREDDEPDR